MSFLRRQESKPNIIMDSYHRRNDRNLNVKNSMKKKILIIIISLIALKTEAQSSVFKVVDSLMLEGKYQLALEKLKNENPKTTRLYENVGAIYYQIGDYNNAIFYFNEGVKLGTSNSIHMRMAKAYDRIGKSKKAIKIYEVIVQNDSTNLIAANSLGKLYINNSRPVSAEKTYRYLIKQDSLNPNFQYQLGNSLMKKGGKFEMVDYFLKAYELDSLHSKSVYRLAEFYKDIKDKDSTLLFIDKGLEISPNDINFLQLKANFSYTSKEYELALVHLKKLMHLNYKTKNIYDMVGMSFSKLEKLDSAKIYFNKALRVERMDSKILFRIAKIYHQQDSLKKATFYAGMSIYGLKPDFDKEYYFLGILQKEAGELNPAIQSFEKAYQNNHGNYKALFELAFASELYYKDKKIALKHYQNYKEKFKSKDEEYTSFVNSKIKHLKTALFMEGEKVK